MFTHKSYMDIQAIRERVWAEVERVGEEDLLALANAMVASVDKHFFDSMVLQGVRERTGASLIVRLMDPPEAANCTDMDMYVLPEGLPGRRDGAQPLHHGGWPRPGLPAADELARRARGCAHVCGAFTQTLQAWNASWIADIHIHKRDVRGARSEERSLVCVRETCLGAGDCM